MKTTILTAICICALFRVHLVYAMWPQIDPHAENYYSQSPYAFAGSNPVNNVDPDGRDYYRSSGGSVIWQDNNARKVSIDGEKYRNIGASYSEQLVDGGFVNYYQNTAISTSDVAVDARRTIFDSPALAGMLLSGDSPLSAHSQAGLMTDLIHRGQGEFIAGAADFAGTALEKSGNGLALAGYAVSATGVGAGVGAAMSGVGNVMMYVGSGTQIIMNIQSENYGQAGILVGGVMMNFGIGRIVKYGAVGKEEINGAANLFFTPVTTMISNIKMK